MSRQLKFLKKLNTPNKIQDFLDKLPFNLERRGETYRSPGEVLKHKRAHCFEGALLALAALHLNGKKAFLLDLKTSDLKNDADHCVTLFTEGRGRDKRWGAISKTNHAVLRFRDPIYLSPREIAASYFHEYFLNDGKKTLTSHSEPFDVVVKFGIDWVESHEDLDEIALALDRSKHYNFYNKSQRKSLRKASKLEIRASLLAEFK